MRHRLISYQKALAICKAESLDFSKIKAIGPFLLKTGAKLGYSQFHKAYLVSGYAHDGSDVEPYATRAGSTQMIVQVEFPKGTGRAEAQHVVALALQSYVDLHRPLGVELDPEHRLVLDHNIKLAQAAEVVPE